MYGPNLYKIFEILKSIYSLMKIHIKASNNQAYSGSNCVGGKLKSIFKRKSLN